MSFSVIEKSEITENKKNFFAYSAWPTVCADENDVLYAVCSGFRMAHVCPFGKVTMYKSRNKGSKWSVPSVIRDSYLDDRDPSIIYLGNGKMIMMTFRHPADVYNSDFRNCIVNDSGKAGEGILESYSLLEGEDRKGGSFYCLSDDYGETWSEEKRLPIHCPHGPIVLGNGDIFLFGKEMYAYGAEQEGALAAYISRDSGLSFEKAGNCPIPEGMNQNQFHEPHCIELDDGRIMGVIRTHVESNDHYFTVFRTFSDDCGKTWSTPEATGICGSPPHLLKTKEGKIIITYARRVEPYGIYGKVIEPDGTFNEEEFLIDDAFDSDIGYPASAQLSDGTIVTVYYKKGDGEKKCSIFSTRWEI